MAHLFTSSLFPFSIFLYFSFIASSFSDKHSSTFASTQTRFWSENVKNEMPAAISTKLSPLTKLDSDYYTKTISQINFKADTKFCSLAKLACSASASSPSLQAKIYKIYAAKHSKPTPSLENIDPFSFFRSSNLKQGDTIHLSSLQESLAQRAFLPPQIASKLSLTLKSVTQFFPHSSKDAIETTLSYCNSAAIKGEFQSCPKSLEEMINFSKITLGASKLLALTSKNTAGSDKMLVIEKVKQFNAEKIVGCHEIFLPFATYYCHSLPSSRIYAVDLIEPTTRTPVNTALAVCHMDTSSWPEEHVAFKILKFGPGQGEACHWMNEIDLAWINADVDNI
ncbi:hypothetical protein C2S52_015158 [Perilla frutescens var. hirtella]|nr:hypothetical protein C2S52_015158 [Perilla frutescens var. hirtella]